MYSIRKTTITTLRKETRPCTHADTHIGDWPENFVTEIETTIESDSYGQRIITRKGESDSYGQRIITRKDTITELPETPY